MCKFTIIYPFYDYYYSTLIYHLYHDYHLFKYWSMESGTSDVVEFDLDTLEPLANTGDVKMTDFVDEIPLPYSPSSGYDVYSRNASDSDFSENNNYYEVSTDSEDNDLPSYSINNLEMTIVEGNEVNILVKEVEDTLNHWCDEMIDSGPSYVPFLGSTYTNIQNPHGKPEVFFESLFDERMWTIIADATNVYARAKRVTEDSDRCTDPTHPDYKKFCCLN